MLNEGFMLKQFCFKINSVQCLELIWNLWWIFSWLWNSWHYKTNSNYCQLPLHSILSCNTLTELAWKFKVQKFQINSRHVCTDLLWNKIVWAYNLQTVCRW